MDLNKLPKDMLIKLICTIEKDTREKIFAQRWSISRDLHNCHCCSGLYHANHKWRCVPHEGKHGKGICNRCYSTLSQEVKKRYAKCEHYTEI